MDTPKGWGGDKISAVHHLPWPFAVAVGPNRRSIVGDTMAETALSAIRPAPTWGTLPISPRTLQNPNASASAHGGTFFPSLASLCDWRS